MEGHRSDHVPPAETTDWPTLHARLSDRAPNDLSAVELDEFAEALMWMDEPQRSAQVWGEAHRRWSAIGDHRRAAHAAWRVFYEHWLVGETTVARGWLERCRRHVAVPNSAAAGWLAIADGDVALADGAFPVALQHTTAACELAAEHADPDLLAMALQAHGRALISNGQTDEGLGCLDEAMVSVIGGELSSVYTGWVYCNVIATCYSIGELRRAKDWSEASLRWCATLREGSLYPGLCRVYAAELAHLSGDWDRAVADADRARADLEAFDERYAGAAHYLIGDLRRQRGQTEAALQAFERAHACGYQPQPGLSLLHADLGRLTESIRALRSVALAGVGDTLVGVRLLVALTDLSARAGDATSALEAAAELASIAQRNGADVIAAYARLGRGRAEMCGGDIDAAQTELRLALRAFLEMGLTPEIARARLLVAEAAEAAGDVVTADLERAAAHRSLKDLGVPTPTAEETNSGPAGATLTARELGVLQLVAAGHTNKQIAERLFVSHHTVARHLSNISAKLGTSSRTAAVSAAISWGLIDAK